MTGFVHGMVGYCPQNVKQWNGVFIALGVTEYSQIIRQLNWPAMLWFTVGCLTGQVRWRHFKTTWALVDIQQASEINLSASVKAEKLTFSSSVCYIVRPLKSHRLVMKTTLCIYVHVQSVFVIWSQICTTL